MWADPLVTRYIGGKPFSRHETWLKLLRYLGHWSVLGYGYWAVEEKASASFVGELGFADFKRELQPPIEGIPECGWVMASHAHRKGYATEALQAAFAWGDENLNSERTVCIIDPGNLPSLRLAEKLGYRKLVTTTYGGHSTILFERVGTAKGQ
jgi:RimJ/RimL family protein N-acetyltransferase